MSSLGAHPQDISLVMYKCLIIIISSNLNHCWSKTLQKRVTQTVVLNELKIEEHFVLSFQRWLFSKEASEFQL